MQGQYTRQFDGVGSGTVFPRFFTDAVQDELATAKEGRPIFREVERVEIIMPGNPHLRPVQNVDDSHRQRWPREYEAFKQGKELALDGTPLEQWPMLNKAQVAELKALQLRTVEDVARLTDNQVQQFRIGGARLRDAAAAYLDEAAQTAVTSRLGKENDELRAQIASLELSNANMKEQLDKLWQAHQDRLNAPHPSLTTIPGMSDPVEAASQAFGAAQRHEEPVGSAFDTFAAPKRRGRPPRSQPLLPNAPEEAA